MTMIILIMAKCVIILTYLIIIFTKAYQTSGQNATKSVEMYSVWLEIISKNKYVNCNLVHGA